MNNSCAVAAPTVAASRLKRVTATAVQVEGPCEANFARPATLTTREHARTSTARNSNRFSTENPAKGLQSSGDGAPILLSLVGPRRCLATCAAAESGRTWPAPPVLELEGCFGGASIDGEVVPRRSQAARETPVIWIFADSSCGNAPAPIRRPCQRPNIRSEVV